MLPSLASNLGSPSFLSPWSSEIKVCTPMDARQLCWVIEHYTVKPELTGRNENMIVEEVRILNSSLHPRAAWWSLSLGMSAS